MNLTRRDLLEALGLALAAGVTAKGAHGATRTGSGTAHVNVQAFGASVKASGSANRRAFARAIAATPTGGTLLVPVGQAQAFVIDTAGGLAAALQIDRPMTISLQGHVRSTHGASGPNPPYLFNVTGDDVTISGRGSIAGPGPVDDRNLQDDTQHAGLIRVTGNRFRFVGPTVIDMPKVGILLWACHDALVSARWRGGVKDYVKGNTGLFGVRATGGGRHRIIANRFERDRRNRRLITGYFAGGTMGGTTGDEIRNNIADVHEKLAYLYSSDSRVADCRVVDALQTDIVRIIGSRNLVENVIGKRIQGGVSIYNGVGNVVRRCVFEEVRQQGVFVGALGSYRDGFSGTVVTGNRIRSDSAATGLQDGITLFLEAGTASNVTVTGNEITASGAARWRNGIRIEAVPPYFVDNAVVEENRIAGAVNALRLRRLSGGAIARNAITSQRDGEDMVRIIE